MAFQPLCGWLISGCRSATQYALAAMVLFFALGVPAQTTNALSDLQIRGRQLAQQLLEQRPAENFTNTGVLQIRDGKGKRSEIPVRCKVVVTATNWQTGYFAGNSVENAGGVVVVHVDGQPNAYFPNGGNPNPANWPPQKLKAAELMDPLVPSCDFWICDLGLEFLHWPGQNILRGETMRGVFCKVLESTNPNPPTNGYSRVVTWIDNESLGIVQAKAYDAKGNLLKDFYPNDVKKVNGQWQVGSMEIYNVQTRSRTTLEFDLKAK